jgi:hypothetical protein
MTSVLSAGSKMVSIIADLRPCWSAYPPITTAPSGRMK